MKKPALTLLLAAAALAAVLGAALSGGVAGAQAPAPASPLIFAGPGERSALVSWYEREDPRNRGISLGWQRGGFGGSPVRVPNVVRPQDYTGRAGTLNYEGSIAWYRTSFQASRAGVYALSFQSANFLAQVWVDGHLLATHRGSYLPFEARAALTAGEHAVVVRVDWRNPSEQSREGFHRTWFNWGGLDGEVEVRPVGETELYDPALQTTLSAGAAGLTATTHIRVAVDVRNNGPGREITPEGSLSRGRQSIPLVFTTVTLAHGQSATAVASAEVPEAALWSTASPNLYLLSLSAGPQSTYSARVGLRQLTWNEGRLYLNGNRLLLHGATVQEDAPGHGDALTPGDDQRLIEELQQIGANALRSQHPLDPALLERLDAAGILVWQGIGPVEGAGNWYSITPQLLAEAERQARTAAVAEQLHPSVFAWNLADEVAGDGRDSQELAYVQNTARWLHAHDPTRMVAVDVWGDHPPTVAGPLYAGIDAVAETDYSGWYDYPTDTPGQVIARMRARLGAMQRTFAGKVLVISEFGAESNTLNPPGAPGSYSYQSQLLKEHIDVYEADPKLSAMFIWLLRDYPLTPTFQGGSIHAVLPRLRLIEGLNQKGLFTRGGQAKPAAALVGRLFAALGPG
jgi:hypothetical protein